ncbi:hypothetical protein ACFY1A_16990 [Streptomyces sp. NPDC001520]|uniref:hypothetical protein n=1 Tax=Streptomyces sp. NPDC001520 TaxID=3364581 RepID=UPI0036BD6306
MSSLFERACREYFAAKLNADVGSVVFDYDEGYRYSSYTYQDPEFQIRVYGPNGEWVAGYEDTTAGELLTELFAWEGAA